MAHQQNIRMLTALRETQIEHGQRLDAIDARLVEHDRRFDAVDRRFDAVDRRFDAVDRRFDAIDTQLSEIRGTIGRVAVGMYALDKLVRRIVPDDGEDAPN
jgi:hypothetical protein